MPERQASQFSPGVGEESRAHDVLRESGCGEGRRLICGKGRRVITGIPVQWKV